MAISSRRRRSSVVSGVITLAADTFNRIAAALGVASDGGVWNIVGAWNTNGTQATCAAANAFAERDAGQANYTYSFKVVLKQNCNSLAFWRRTVDSNNQISFAVNDATHWFINDRVGGVDSPNFAELIAVADGDVITIVANGPNSIIKVNGVTILTHVNATLVTGTKLGFSTGGSLAGTATYDDFLVTT